MAKLKTVVSVASGNFLEMYDFMIFGYYADAIGRIFFPGTSNLKSLMSALATFGVGFLMRPLGALILGGYIDRQGRRKGLILTLALMSAGVLSIALLPGYSVLGWLAPLLMIAGRLVQGFSAGVELGAVSVYLSEIATPGHKGFYVSWQSASQQCAVIFAALLGVSLSHFLSQAKIDAWGWRIPMLAGCAIVPLLFWMRQSLTESEEFLAAKHPSASEVWRSLRVNWRLIGSGAMAVVFTTAAFYVITAYTATYGKLLHLAPRENRSSRSAWASQICSGCQSWARCRIA